MFKSILPSRRIPSSDFTMITGPPDVMNGKENYPALTTTTNVTKPRLEKTKKSRGKEQVVEAQEMEHAFDRLLDDLQIPTTLRPKLATMESSVKAAMLKSSQTLAVGKGAASPPMTPRGFRKAHSSESLSSPRPQNKQALDEYDLFRLRETHGRGFNMSLANLHTAEPFPTTGHARGVSIDVPSNAAGVQQRFIPQLDSVPGKPSREKAGKGSTMTPARCCNILTSTSSTQLDVEVVKKLRLLLRNEAASWTQEFIQRGGYSALLTRLNEILEVEWREEQHDDQILHELLRCIKAMSTSAIGCAALRSCCPTPFAQLVSLLYSDKKPGEVGTRQLILELLHTLFDLYPPSSLPSAGSPNLASHSHARSPSIPWESAPSSSLINLPSPHATLFSLIRALLLTPAPPPSEEPRTPVAPHAFIEELHIPRIYKTYLQELSDVCRDYFWVFCHPNNTIWNLEETDEGKVERPRAPGGMTGGVEFEAMSYMTTHFKFINAIAKAARDLNMPKEHELSAHRLHSDLFLSGFDRIILVSRKASTTYYPTLHLEIARYISAAGRAGYELPWSVARLIGPPPTTMCKPGHSRNPRAQAQSSLGRAAPGSPTRRGGVVGVTSPQLPQPRKVTPMFN